MTPQNSSSSCSIKETVDYRAGVFLTVHVLNQNNNKKYYAFMKLRPLIRCLIHIGGRLDVNQPLLNFSEPRKDSAQSTVEWMPPPPPKKKEKSLFSQAEIANQIKSNQNHIFYLLDKITRIEVNVYRFHMKY